MNDPVWVFGYGSLMWDPGFDVAESRIGRLHGYGRSFCMWSIHHRGTVEKPGLVLALDEQAATHCDGLVLRVADGHESRALSYLRARELISSAYVEKVLPVELDDGSVVDAVTYVIDEQHEQYCSGLALPDQARIIAEAIGGRGTNPDYLYNTVAHMAEIGISDPELDWLARRVKQICAATAQ